MPRAEAQGYPSSKSIFRAFHWSRLAIDLGEAHWSWLHALTDRFCRPIAFLLTGGQVADCTAADILLDQMPATLVLHGDKGYDTNAVREKIEAMGATPNIPPKTNRRWKPCFSPVLYRDRNAIERMFGRIKDFRRGATRYDRLEQNFLAAVCLAAIICYWL